MYVISNQQRDDIIKFLAALKELPGKDNRTYNTIRRAGITAKQLERAKYISHEEVKRLKMISDEKETDRHFSK